MTKTFINIKFPEEWLYHRKLLTDPEILQWINELLERNVHFSTFQPLNQSNGVSGIIALVDQKTSVYLGVADDNGGFDSELIFQTFDKNPEFARLTPPGSCVIAGDEIYAGIDADDAAACKLKNAIVITFSNKKDMGEALRAGKVEFKWRE